MLILLFVSFQDLLPVRRYCFVYHKKIGSEMPNFNVKPPAMATILTRTMYAFIALQQMSQRVIWDIRQEFSVFTFLVITPGRYHFWHDCWTIHIPCLQNHLTQKLLYVTYFHMFFLLYNYFDFKLNTIFICCQENSHNTGYCSEIFSSISFYYYVLQASESWVWMYFKFLTLVSIYQTSKHLTSFFILISFYCTFWRRILMCMWNFGCHFLVLVALTRFHFPKFLFLFFDHITWSSNFLLPAVYHIIFIFRFSNIFVSACTCNKLSFCVAQHSKKKINGILGCEQILFAVYHLERQHLEC